MSGQQFYRAQWHPSMWVVSAVLLLVGGALNVLDYYRIVTDHPRADPLPQVVLFTLLLVMLVTSLFTTGYELRKDEIVSKSVGFVLRRVKYQNILSVTRHSQAMAVSFHPVPGLLVKGSKGKVFAVVDDENAFLESLRDRAPHLRRYGHELRSEPSPV